MTKEELIDLLQKHEWRDVEFKAAANNVPKDAYKTVSAFSNTSGGHLVFGVSENGAQLEISGVQNVDKVQNDFLSSLRGDGKFSKLIEAVEDLIEHENKTLLIFYIPEASRLDKPICLERDPKRSFIRRGGGDEKCNEIELARFLRDATDRPWCAELVEDLDAEDFFDESSLKWYRGIYERTDGGRHSELSDVEFLDEWGLVCARGDTMHPTRAGVLLFGEAKHVRRLVGRPVVDYQRHDCAYKDWSPDMRWNDRHVVEANIVQAWRELLDRYHRLSEHQFALDADTLRRTDDPPDYISFRESLINLLVHQDYGDASRTPRFQIFQDRTIFWNPGPAFDPTSDLLEATEKALRNPDLANGFRRIGLSDQAGTGIRTICRNWRQLGHQPPIFKNDRQRQAFELTLTKLPLITEKQKLFQAQIGVVLNEEEADLFAYVCEAGEISITTAKTILGKSESHCLPHLQRLTNQVLIEELVAGKKWALATHFAELWSQNESSEDQGASLVTPKTDQAGEVAASLVTSKADQAASGLVTKALTKLTDTHRTILQFCDAPQKQEAIMKKVGVTHRSHFRKNHLNPLIKANLIQASHPDKPTHPDQTYCVTEHGLKMIND